MKSFKEFLAESESKNLDKVADGIKWTSGKIEFDSYNPVLILHDSLGEGRRGIVDYFVSMNKTYLKDVKKVKSPVVKELYTAKFNGIPIFIYTEKSKKELYISTVDPKDHMA